MTQPSPSPMYQEMMRSGQVQMVHASQMYPANMVPAGQQSYVQVVPQYVCPQVDEEKIRKFVQSQASTEGHVCHMIGKYDGKFGPVFCYDIVLPHLYGKQPVGLGKCGVCFPTNEG